MKIGLFGGGFKPFTTGHFSKLALALQENDAVILSYSVSERQKGSGFVFDENMARQIYQIVKPALEREFPGRIFVDIGLPTPVVRMFEIIKAVKEGKDNPVAKLTSCGIDPKTVEKITIYSEKDGLERFTTYLGTPREEKYFGDLHRTRRLVFDTGLSVNGGLERLIGAIRDTVPGASEEELGDKVAVRGSQVRAHAAAGDFLRVLGYMPGFLTTPEKEKILGILKGSVRESTFLKYLVKCYATGVTSE